MATALVAYSVVVGTFVTLAFKLPEFIRLYHDGEKSPFVSTRLAGVMGHFQVRDIALGDVIRERVEENGYGPEIEEQMEKLMVELYLEKKKREAGVKPYGARYQTDPNVYAVDAKKEGLISERIPFDQFKGLGRAKEPQL